MMKIERFPVTVSIEGVSAKIRKFTRIKNGEAYTTFVAEYFQLGKRKQEWRSKFEDAKTAALEACRRISRGQQISLTLANGERLEYLRANEAVTPIGVKLDVAAHEYAGAMTLLNGRATITEACRAWLKQNVSELPHVEVSIAVAEIVQQSITDKKTSDRIRHLSAILNRFAGSFNVGLQDIVPALLSQYLAKLPFTERTRRNHRDMIGFFNRFCVLRGYLKRGTDWLDGVQNYSARKMGAIEIYTPDEMKLLLSGADNRLIPFLAIGAFAGLRHAEIDRLDWNEIEISDQAGESFIEVRSIENTKSDQRRRLVPISDNLKAWLLPYRKAAGKVCPFKNITKQLLKLAAKVGMTWKHNALRHSCISYRVAASGDVSRVADDCGNSVYVIRTNYLRRVKPAVAAEWFAIVPV
jgi:integrase